MIDKRYTIAGKPKPAFSGDPLPLPNDTVVIKPCRFCAERFSTRSRNEGWCPKPECQADKMRRRVDAQAAAQAKWRDRAAKEDRLRKAGLL